MFKLAPDGDGTETVLYRFQGSDDGALPGYALILDKAGNLYGTTSRGGAGSWGTVFKLSPGGVETVLHAFALGTGGAAPTGLIADGHGNLYGTTYLGGDFCGVDGCGTIFRITE